MPPAKKNIRIDFCDFFGNFNKADNFIVRLLSERFDVQIYDKPDFLIHSCFGQEHRLHSCVRVLFSGESDMPDYRQDDYTISCVKLDDSRHLQYPNYVHYGDPSELVKKNDEPEQILASKTKFCSFVIGGHNKKNHNRVAFFEKLSKYKKVDSAGRKLNNIGGPIPHGSRHKIEFLKQYEIQYLFLKTGCCRAIPRKKIFEAMVARCLPIYCGKPADRRRVQSKSFLNYFDFPSEDALIEKIIELDKDDAKYMEYLRQPYFHNDQPNTSTSAVNDNWISTRKSLPPKSYPWRKPVGKAFPLAASSGGGSW